MTFIPNGQLRAVAIKHFSPALERMALAGMAQLGENLSQPGSGIQHEGLPNRSSAPGEFPAEQFGHLINSVDARKVNDLHWRDGVFDAPGYALKLEFEEPEFGGRSFIRRTFFDRDVWVLMLAAGGQA